MNPTLAYIISQVNFSLAFLSLADSLKKTKKYKLIFILLNNKETDFERILIQQSHNVYRVNYSNKSDVLPCIFKIRRILQREKVSIVHTHLFEAGLIGILAARLALIPKRIHTRHDATIHHDYHPHAIKYDKLTNRLSTHIIAITENVKEILTKLEGVNENKITIIHHGFDLNIMKQFSQESIQQHLDRYFPNGKPFPIIGVVARFMEWKGIQYIIPAFSNFKKNYPNAHLVMANASGPFKNELEKLLFQLPANSYTTIEFEKDMVSLYYLFDLFIHVPVSKRSEAFGQVYIEAMATGKSSIFTLSGIASEIIQHEHNALVVPYRDSTAITDSLLRLMKDPSLKEKISLQAKNDVSGFAIENMISKLEALYDA